MRKKILLDILFYLVVPLLTWNLGKPYIGEYYAIFAGCIPALIYTMVDFFSTKEFNVSGFFLMLIMILNFVLNAISKTALQELWNGTYVSAIISVIYIVSMLIKKPIGMYFFVDYAYAKGIPRKASLSRYSQKENLRYFQWFTFFLTMREFIVIIVKSYMIVNLGLKSYNLIQIIMQVISYLYLALTLLIVIKIMKMLRKKSAAEAT